MGTLLLFLLLIAGLASAIFLFFFRGYVVDTPDGPRLEMPFLAKETASLPTISNDVSVTIPDKDTNPMPEPLHAILLSSDSIMEKTARTEMQNAGCNAVIYDMRTEDGSLHYVSDLSLAIESGASASLPGLNDAIHDMNETADLYTIARVSCFPDSKLTEAKPDLALCRASGATWKDASKGAWLSPSRDEVQSYLLDICRELSALGFDEILLTNCAYPTKGTVSQVDALGDESIDVLSVTLEDFYKEMRSVLAAQGVHLSIQWEQPPESESNKASSGQTLESLVLSADRVWMDLDYEEAVNVFSTQGLSYSNLSLVSILENPGKSSFSWALL
jgi:hypothetical protein